MIKIKFVVIGLLLSVCVSLAGQNAADTAVVKKSTLFSKVENWYEQNMNYGSITLLMAAESSIFPVPSELVIPPAAYISLKPESPLNIFLVILFATIGALIGATVNYFVLGMLLGRAVMYRFADSKIGHLLLLSSEKLKKAENYFNTHGKISTFVGRFIPVVRHFISIPAGFAKMNYATFAIFTFIGAGLWNCCLAFLGYLAHGQANIIQEYSHEMSIGIVVVTLLVIVYFIVKKVVKKKKDK
jgi:membrane protein DedA with SNARE-associated domain